MDKRRLRYICMVTMIVSLTLVVLSLVILEIGEIVLDNMLQEMGADESSDGMSIFSSLSTSFVRDAVRALLTGGEIPYMNSLSDIAGIDSSINELGSMLIQASFQDELATVNPLMRIGLYFWAYAESVRNISLIVLIISAIAWFLSGGRIGKTDGKTRKVVGDTVPVKPAHRMCRNGHICDDPEMRYCPECGLPLNEEYGCKTDHVSKTPTGAEIAHGMHLAGEDDLKHK